MAIRYWDYWQDSTTNSTSTTTAGQYYNTWIGTSNTSATTTFYNCYTPTVLVPRVERYVLSGFDDWSDHACAVLTRLINDETDTGFKVTMWLRGDVEITDPAIMVRDLDWFLLRLRQVASPADYQKIADHVAQVRAELAIEARSDATGTGAAEGGQHE